MKSITIDRIIRRRRRVSRNLIGNEKIPRLSVFASNKYTYAQLIDDVKRRTLASYSSLVLSKSDGYKRDIKTKEAKKVGFNLAKIALKLGIKRAVFDRNRYAYKGRIKALAEGLREGGVRI